MKFEVIATRLTNKSNRVEVALQALKDMQDECFHDHVEETFEPYFETMGIYRAAPWSMMSGPEYFYVCVQQVGTGHRYEILKLLQ
jgi:hypothetical protein